ncbi:MFS transporter [Arthrobacter sp. ISL-30]|nr:MFS transporter [Arthrobacter sp. ISL-30]
MFPVLLVAVDNTALTFALPATARTLDAGGVQLLWIIDAYPLVLAALLVTMGNLGDRIGRRRLLLIGSTGFAAISVATAFATSPGLLIAGRALLGIFGAMLMPSTLSLIRNIFLEPNRRRLAVAIWAAGFSGGAALGPIFGGWLVEQFWWGAVFLVAAPLLLPLLALGPKLIPESRDGNPGKADIASVALSILTMAAVVYGMKEAAIHGPALLPALSFGVGLAAGVAFVRRQRRLESPMLDVRLFRNATFSTSITANVLSLFSMTGFIFFFAQHLQLIEGLTPMQAGISMIPALVATMAAGLLVVPLVRRVRPGTVVAAGLALSATGYLVVALGNHGNGPGFLLAALLILAIGVGMAETISNDLILGSVPAGKAGAASAISETGYELGSLLGTAVLGSILTASYQHNLRLPEQLSEESAGHASETLAGAVEAASTLPASTSDAVMAAARTAFESGIHITAAIRLVLMATAAVLAAVVLRRVPVAD